ncbi:hypothetical protein SAMN02799632_02069 [Acinetobacter pittii]|uniref:hypothetical protein n=1 Tax=Acinetobacter TaxID=469 RepID=UPI0004530D2D|nr:MULTISPECIES: hypothetical protein [Acinetobacter]EXE84610.1 hypothetical protein J588_3366 [Acinetobacter sp. 1578804]KCX13512.1 hypothetical protein J723_3884 [Acinetobacter sp. 1264765]KQE16386.1 hypothetical protein APD38_12935 [Acinetobacter pittii]KQE30013.1 hypothetical protein APD39_10660 [Acinetobacter pittii]KQE52605.1 hypothetical protein APD46_08130 [Acinetobacter pittii]
MMLYGYHFSTIEHNWEDLKPLNEFLQTFADDDGDVSTRDKESLKEIIAKSDTALALAREMGWDGNYTGCPYLFWLPSKNSQSFEYGFVFKQTSDNTTFVISPIELSYLAEDSEVQTLSKDIE